MQVDVWSDVVCPWCYIGKRRLEAAIQQYGGEVEVRWHSFQLDPSSERAPTQSTTEMLIKKYRISPDRAKAMQMHVTTLAEAEGLQYRLEDTLPENTLDAHRLLQEAALHGLQQPLKERLLSGYFERGERVADPATLRVMAAEVGLPSDRVEAVLADPQLHGAAVRRDIATARELGIQGVPFFVVDQRYGISGAQPASVLLDVLQRARSEREGPADAASGPACADDACDVPGAES